MLPLLEIMRTFFDYLDRYFSLVTAHRCFLINFSILSNAQNLLSLKFLSLYFQRLRSISTKKGHDADLRSLNLGGHVIPAVLM